MRTTISGAIRKTLKEEMAADDKIFIMGEDVGEYGGIFNATRGLIRDFGADRVIDTPLSELAIAGAGIGAAVAGLRPVIEIMYADFLTITMDQIVNNAAKMSYLSCGKYQVPIVIRSNFGIGSAEGAHHTQTPHAWFMNVPGLKIVVPSTPKDACGLLKSSIRDNNPVLFLEHKMLYKLRGEIGDKIEAIPLSKGEIKHEGTDITVVASALMLHKSLKAAEELKKEDDISIEVIDIRTIKPFDEDIIINSVKKTGHLVIVEEAPYTGGWGAQVVDTAYKKLFKELKSPPLRITSPDIPISAMNKLENMRVPSVEKIKTNIKDILENT